MAAQNVVRFLSRARMCLLAAVLLLTGAAAGKGTPDISVTVVTEDERGARCAVPAVAVLIADDNGTILAQAATGDNGTVCFTGTRIQAHRQIRIIIQGTLPDGRTVFQAGSDRAGMPLIYAPGVQQRFVIDRHGRVWPDYLQWEQDADDNATIPAYIKGTPAAGDNRTRLGRAPFMGTVKTPLPAGRVAAGAAVAPQGLLAVHLRGSGGEPLQDITVRLIIGRGDDASVFSGVTDADGTALLSFYLPQWRTVPLRLTVAGYLPDGTALTLPSGCTQGLPLEMFAVAYRVRPYAALACIVTAAGEVYPDMFFFSRLFENGMRPGVNVIPETTGVTVPPAPVAPPAAVVMPASGAEAPQVQVAGRQDGAGSLFFSCVVLAGIVAVVLWLLYRREKP